MDENNKQYFELFTIRDVPVFLHFSSVIALTLFFLLWLIDDFSYFIFYFAVFPIIIIHELGHAYYAQKLNCNVNSICIYVIHGLCNYDEADTLYDNAKIAWGGVLAQFVVLLITTALVLLFGFPQSDYFSKYILCFQVGNIGMLILNLIPFDPLDGKTAWKIIPLWYRHNFKKDIKNPKDSKKSVSHLRVIK